MVRVRQIAVVVGGAGTLVVVAGDGSTPWRVVRAAVVVAVTVGLLALERRRAGGPDVGRDVAEVVVGLAGLAVGVGIGARGVLAAGPSLRVVSGLLVLVAGLVLTVTGTSGLVRRVPGWWRLLALPAVLAVLVLVVFPLSIAVMATNVPPTEDPEDPPAALGPTARTVGVPTRDGVRLEAWYVPSTNGAAVVLLHGASSTRASVVPEARVLVDAGYGVLLLDARGHGSSGGRAMDLGWYGDRDVVGALDALVDLDPSVAGRIGVVGFSMGGEEAIGAAAADDRIAAVVAEGATNRTRADKGWLPGGVAGALQDVIDVVTYTATDVLTDASPPTALRDAVARAAPTPVLLVTAGDVPDERTAAEWIRAGSPATVQVWTVPGASHTDGLRTDPQGWTDRVVGFLDEHLAPTG